MVRTQIYLEQEHLVNLRRIADTHDRSVSELVREAIDLYLGREAMNPWDLIVGIGASGRDDGALNHDEVYDR